MKTKNNKNIIRQTEYSLENKQTLPLLEFELLRSLPWIRHGFTTKAGGVSEGIYESLNLSYTRGDSPQAVDENFRRIAEVFHVTKEKIVTSEQTHTVNVRLVTAADAGKGIVRPRDYTDVDGLITKEKGLLLATFYADCVPLFFADPVQRAIGLSHSGWRGTVARMGSVTVKKMQEAFGSRPEDIVCAVGPSICADCYEVSDDVAQAFYTEFKDDADNMLKDKGNGKYQLDLWKANEIVLRQAGITQEHMAITNICTCCNSDVLFSHRATQGKRGNLGAFLMITEN